ncbi:Glycoside hydrolase family 17 [Macrophomina phaseolina MS6]|uniref:glucan endo-1,3-beta-D-glucosidase n=1 Tax=Macrophomina phaseolina (strain MS6) TaxID=1126212 RepID=K2QYX3_MACPH|nr:Glycoside hydrolase family 17 [Macrophomina phaseolina MS6]
MPIRARAACTLCPPLKPTLNGTPLELVGNHLSGNQPQSYEAYSPYSRGSPPALNPAAYNSQEPLTHPSANDSRPSLNSHSNHSANDGYSSFSDDPYNYHSRSAPFGAIDPNEIEDDGDDGIPVQPKRKTLLGKRGVAAVGAAGAAGAGAGLSHDGSGSYGPLPGGTTEYSHDARGVEKSAWGAAAANKNGKKRLWTIVLAALVVIAVIVGVVVGGILGSRAGSPDDTKDPAAAAQNDQQKNGDLDKDSDEIKKLMNNPDLHRVFPGMDYTPLNAQYPDCLHNPPSQNNITRDVAVLSQLTPAIRLYGTDCNQTEMVLHAIDRLGISDSTKVWLGVWLGNNDTTNDRQIAQFWQILDQHKADPFAGVIVGNEVLYRKDLTSDELAKILADVKKNLTDHNWDLPLATSDLGDNWTEDLASEVDVVMANIHPFFAGVEAQQAASWTWSFWQNHDVAVTKNLQGKTHVISETGWPSGGGNDCGESTCTSDTQGSVAGINEMNIFLDDWVCQALKNGTEYFWFELFDEPWKIRYNTKDENWEDKWGLMTVDRELKNGVKIPDCGGQQATLPSKKR